MKIFFDNFRQTQAEFLALAQLTKEILQSMGIILRALKGTTPRGGVNKPHFDEFDDDHNYHLSVEMHQILSWLEPSTFQ